LSGGTCAGVPLRPRTLASDLPGVPHRVDGGSVTGPFDLRDFARAVFSLASLWKPMTTELELIRELYRYNSKGRQGYLRKIWRLPPKARYRDRGASFPSVVDIYMHILDAYRWWFLKVYAKTDFDEYPLGARYTLAEARRETRKVDRMLDDFLRDLRPKDLDRRITLPGRGREQLTIRTMLVHMVEEELQHKGELNALLWQQDVDAPVLGFDQQ